MDAPHQMATSVVRPVAGNYQYREDERYKIQYERYMKRWIESGDRDAMLRLLRSHHVASYFCKGHTNLEPYSLWHGDLVGTYDIVFLAVDPIDTGTNAPANFPSVSRAVTTGVLTLMSKVAHGLSPHIPSRRCVHGSIQGVTATHSGRLDKLQEESRQELALEFCQAPIALQGKTIFNVTHVDRVEVAQNDHSIVTSYGILTEPGAFGWSPTEGMPQSHRDMEYTEFMQKEMEQRYHGKYKWKEEHSWLCQHMGLPLEAAQAIHAFNYHPLPSPKWSWRAGDLLLSIRLERQKSSSLYLARPRDPSRLLKKIRDRYPILQTTLETGVYHDSGEDTDNYCVSSDDETAFGDTDTDSDDGMETEDDGSCFDGVPNKRPRLC